MIVNRFSERLASVQKAGPESLLQNLGLTPTGLMLNIQESDRAPLNIRFRQKD